MSLGGTKLGTNLYYFKNYDIKKISKKKIFVKENEESLNISRIFHFQNEIYMSNYSFDRHVCWSSFVFLYLSVFGNISRLDAQEENIFNVVLTKHIHVDLMGSHKKYLTQLYSHEWRRLLKGEKD